MTNPKKQYWAIEFAKTGGRMTRRPVTHLETDPADAEQALRMLQRHLDDRGLTQKITLTLREISHREYKRLERDSPIGAFIIGGKE
jgi:7-keto-8-aminopelargonate synthetase-like enzyme